MLWSVRALSSNKHLFIIEDFPTSGRGLMRYLKPGITLLSMYTPTTGSWCGSKAQIVYCAGRSPREEASNFSRAGTEIGFDDKVCSWKK